MKLEYTIGGIIVVALVIGALVYVGEDTMNISLPENITDRTLTAEEKAARYVKAPELVEPDGYINTPRLPSGVAGPITLSELAGDKVVLLDIWTYSCINCQRTLPYLRAWHEKYRDEGLVIIGLHTPEFAFEKVLANVEKAVQGFQLTYPVVLDNEYKTWNAYGNNYWPRKYLIDIDGYIVYDHIGEGAYEETEKQIQKALAERAKRLGGEMPDSRIAAENVVAPRPERVRSPETYFGAWRNENLGNGTAFAEGEQTLTIPERLVPDALYLGGSWKIEREYAESTSSGARIHFSYDSKDVYFVASAEEAVRIRVTRDGGASLGEARGADVAPDGIATIREDRLYRLIEDSDYAEHTIEIEILTPNLKAYTFTFG